MEKHTARWSDFSRQHPDVAAWIERKQQSFEFAASLGDAVANYGHLSERQLAAAMNCIAKDAARASAPPVNAPAADASALEVCFAKAKGNGLKAPKLRLGAFAFKPAPAHGKNPGAIYVMSRSADGEYLGKVMGGRLQLLRAHQDQEAAVLAVIEDPQSAAIAYGKEFGVCAICGRDLSDPVSVERGIGPICADKFF